MQPLRIGYLSTMYHTSHIIRQGRWIEQSLGLEPAWALFGTGPAMVEAFRSGSIDAGYIGLPPAMIGMAAGVPLVCVAGGHAEGTVVIARSDACPADPGSLSVQQIVERFSGGRIGAPSQGSIHDVIVRHLIAEHAPGRVEVVNYPWADLIPDALDEGEIHGAAGTPPLAVLGARWHGHRVVLPPGRIWPFNPSYGIVVTRALLARRTLLEDFLGLHERACNLIRQQPGQAAEMVACAVKVVDAAFVREVFDVSPRYCAALPQPYIDAAMAFVPVLRRMGYLQGDLAAGQVFDLSLIEKVHPDGHHY